MKKTRLDRADGRYLYYYSFDASPPEVLALPERERGHDRIELRWNAMLGDWVVISTGRQGRTFLPPDEYCPLCPTASPDAFPTEIPSSDFEVVVFENRWPSFLPDAPEVRDDSVIERRARAVGACELVVYSPEHEATLASLSRPQRRHLVDVWIDRYAELSARPEVEYVFIFENRGKEIGVTLTHPHGQIYAFPYIPPRVATEQAAFVAHAAANGRACLICDTVANERRRGLRVVAETLGWVAYVPFAARLPYEVHVAPVSHRGSLLDLEHTEQDGLAAILHDVQAMYDALWGFAMPYTMSMHQRPVDGIERPGEHLHIEFMPPYRTKDKLKYLAGVETGAGTFINDTAPEEKAQELREARTRATTV